ncbi:MAG: TraR/DksA C4-type zinc finger protein [Planctomycetes bacterium]|nr:TraR/DksA C4-type zinc finger protein [Planctomycetota bacterium]
MAKKAAPKKAEKQAEKKAEKKTSTKAPARKPDAKAAKSSKPEAKAGKETRAEKGSVLERADAAAFVRTATKLPGKGVLVRLKRAGGAKKEAEESVNPAFNEKSKGESPVTLHHRTPTKAEIEEFREALVARRNQLQGDVKGLEEEAFSEETQHVSTNHLADNSFEQYEQEFNLSMIESETEELKEIARALEKLDSGTFGICESCGINISIERLSAMPYTRICIHCRNRFESEGGGEEFGVLAERRV